MSDVVTSRSGEQPVARRRPRSLVRLARAATSSVVATLISQITLLVLLWWDATNATVASAAAFAAGAIPNYFVSRRWAWGRGGKPAMRAELVPYLLVIAMTGCASVGLTTLTSWLIEPLALPHLVHVLLLDGAYAGSYVLVFLVKFTLLDRFVFARGAAHTLATTSQP